MRVAILSPIAWRTPPVHYGPWELVASLITEEMVRLGQDVTLFATAESITSARLSSVTARGYEEDRSIDAKVVECLHISECFEHASDFDIIHNHFDFLPLTYSRLVDTPMVTTIHGFSSSRILPVYKKYNASVQYVSISDADRSPELEYAGTVYHGIDLASFPYKENPSRSYLLYYGRIHPDKGTREAIEISRAVHMPLLIAGIIQDMDYFKLYVEPFLQEGKIEYLGSVGADKRAELLGNAYALLHPISFNEPFGLSVVEAMACGTPVIAFKKGSMSELITDGVDGFLCASVEEAIGKIPSVAGLDRHSCRITVENRFTSSKMAADYLEIYRRISGLR